jgi:TPR repeat protein
MADAPDAQFAPDRRTIGRRVFLGALAVGSIRYDGELTDVFTLQDEITKKVIAAIEPKLLEAEGTRSQGRSPEDLGAWDMVIQTNSLLWRLIKIDIEAAIAMLRLATERYRDYAPAHSMLAFALLFRAIPVGISGSQDVKEAVLLASRAAELDDSDPWAHLALGWAAFLMSVSGIFSHWVLVSSRRRKLDTNKNTNNFTGWPRLSQDERDQG